MAAMLSLHNGVIAARHVPAAQSRDSGVRLAPSCSPRLPARRASVLRRAVQTDDKGPATQFNNEELNAKLKETLADVQKKWDETEEKPAVIAIAFMSFLVIWGLGGVLDAIDRLPLISNFLELVGLVVTTWFAYRYLIFGPDRQELRQNISEFYDKVTGKKSTLN